MYVAALHHQIREAQFTKFGEEVFIGQTPNKAKFCGDPTRNFRGIHDRKFVLPEKVGQRSPVWVVGYLLPAKLRPFPTTPVLDICCQALSILLPA